MSSDELKLLKEKLAVALFFDVNERRKVLLTYLVYICQINIDEFSGQFNSYIYACTPENKKLPPMAFAILDDIVEYITKNNLSQLEITERLCLSCSNEIINYIKANRLLKNELSLAEKKLALESEAC